jgi:hypothetical protein
MIVFHIIFFDHFHLLIISLFFDSRVPLRKKRVFFIESILNLLYILYFFCPLNLEKLIHLSLLLLIIYNLL